ncbi:MAG TPA: sigma-70 family RNA polymerase sigma factor [Gemmataceae bacterium]|jgi:RNA polymerase sigma-70 factor (ECF subfamily)|nr:sigma-70 family RNA polymerase sigma factor [Gemmataceae bacterium]
MITVLSPNPPELEDLIRRAADGDDAARVDLFAQHRDRLKSVVRVRLDDRLRGRIDEADVLQEVYLVFAGRLAEYADDPAVPFYLWLRNLAVQRLIDLHRHHIGAQKRAVSREYSIDRGGGPGASSVHLANLLLGKLTPVTDAAIRKETRRMVQEALDDLSTADREVLVLRYFEQLTNDEVAAVLGLSRTAANNRYVRALARFARVVKGLPGL